MIFMIFEFAKFLSDTVPEIFGNHYYLNIRYSDYFLRFKVVFAWRAQVF